MLKKIKLKGEQKKVLFLPPKNPIQIKGVAGSGKTTVALYRAKHLLETEANLFKESKIVIFTYNKTLAAYINKLRPYINGGYQKDNDDILPNSPDGLNVKIINFHSWAYYFVGIQYDKILTKWKQIDILKNIIKIPPIRNSNINEKSLDFFLEEISWIKGKLFKTKNEYIESARRGRGTFDRVSRYQKDIIWDVFEQYNLKLERIGKIDFDDFAILALKKIENYPNFVPPYSHIIIDEAQDLNKAQMLTISKLVDKETNSLTIIADAAQRIYKSGFTWSEIGIEVRGGRTIAFKKNYRNTIEIAKAAKSLLINEKDNEDFTEIEFSLNSGDLPIIGYFSSFEDQMDYVISELKNLIKDNQMNGTVILHRNKNGVKLIKSYLDKNDFSSEIINTNLPINYESDSIKICTMSSIKGLEFDNVFIIDLNDNIIPYPQEFNEEDDEVHISTERRLLYTCMTRARNKLFLFSSAFRSSRYLKEIDPDLIRDITPLIPKKNYLL